MTYILIIGIVFGFLYFLGKHIERKQESEKNAKRNAYYKRLLADPNHFDNIAPKFTDPRTMTLAQFMEYLGLDPNDSQDKESAKSEKPAEHVFDNDDIVIWRAGDDKKCIIVIEYDGGTITGERAVDLYEISLHQSADSIIIAANCHAQNEERHFVANRIKNLKYNNMSYDFADFCSKILRISVLKYVDSDDLIYYLDSLNGVPFDAKEHYNDLNLIKHIKKQRAKTKSERKRT